MRAAFLMMERNTLVVQSLLHICALIRNTIRSDMADLSSQFSAIWKSAAQRHGIRGSAGYDSPKPRRKPKPTAKSKNPHAKSKRSAADVPKKSTVISSRSPSPPKVKSIVGSGRTTFRSPLSARNRSPSKSPEKLAHSDVHRQSSAEPTPYSPYSRPVGELPRAMRSTISPRKWTSPRKVAFVPPIPDPSNYFSPAVKKYYEEKFRGALHAAKQSRSSSAPAGRSPGKDEKATPVAKKAATKAVSALRSMSPSRISTPSRDTPRKTPQQTPFADQFQRSNGESVRSQRSSSSSLYRLTAVGDVYPHIYTPEGFRRPSPAPSGRRDSEIPERLRGSSSRSTSPSMKLDLLSAVGKFEKQVAPLLERMRDDHRNRFRTALSQLKGDMSLFLLTLQNQARAHVVDPEDAVQTHGEDQSAYIEYLQKELSHSQSELSTVRERLNHRTAMLSKLMHWTDENDPSNPSTTPTTTTTNTNSNTNTIPSTKSAMHTAATATHIDTIRHTPSTANPTTVNPTTANPTAANPTTANPTTANPTTANPTTSVDKSASSGKALGGDDRARRIRELRMLAAKVRSQASSPARQRPEREREREREREEEEEREREADDESLQVAKEVSANASNPSSSDLMDFRSSISLSPGGESGGSGNVGNELSSSLSLLSTDEGEREREKGRESAKGESEAEISSSTFSATTPMKPTFTSPTMTLLHQSLSLSPHSPPSLSLSSGETAPSISEDHISKSTEISLDGVERERESTEKERSRGEKERSGGEKERVDGEKERLGAERETDEYYRDLEVEAVEQSLKALDEALAGRRKW